MGPRWPWRHFIWGMYLLDPLEPTFTGQLDPKSKICLKITYLEHFSFLQKNILLMNFKGLLCKIVIFRTQCHKSDKQKKFFINEKCLQYVIFIINFQSQTQKCALRESQTSCSPRAIFLASRTPGGWFFWNFFLVGHFYENSHCLLVTALLQL